MSLSLWDDGPIKAYDDDPPTWDLLNIFAAVVPADGSSTGGQPISGKEKKVQIHETTSLGSLMV